MFRAFYSLSSRPFDKEIKSRDMFASASHQELLARLDYLREHRGIGLVVGEPGLGKTSTLRAFTSALNTSLYQVVYFQLSTVTVSDFYRGLAFNLDLEPAFRKIDLFQQIQGAILSLYSEKKVTPVIILDELQLASSAFLNDLHLLFNFVMDSENPFVLVLCGLAQLAVKLSLAHHQVLSQRVIMRYRMQPLTRAECGAYLEHQMRLAGARYPVFTDSAVEAIATVSRGWPRLINNLGTTSLVYGCQKNLKEIDEEAVHQASIETNI
jgi:type II secretory pathway predicted ATPase ExeA